MAFDFQLNRDELYSALFILLAIMTFVTVHGLRAR
jgi:hypothetical protein